MTLQGKNPEEALISAAIQNAFKKQEKQEDLKKVFPVKLTTVFMRLWKMNSHQKTINLLSICRKAGRLVIGFDAVKDAVIKGDVSCVLVTENISPKTLKEIKFFCGNSNTDIVGIDTNSDEMFNLLRKKVVVAAVTDLGFGKKFTELGRLVEKNSAEKDNCKP